MIHKLAASAIHLAMNNQNESDLSYTDIIPDFIHLIEF